jgi:glycosyltransferase involved in cell wall biosynthesis
MGSEKLMKILFLAYFGEGENGNHFGGAEKVLTNLANWMLNNTQHEVIFSSIGVDVLPYPLDKNMTYKHYDADLSTRLKTQLSLISNVRKTLYDFNPDVIISFSIHPMFHLAMMPNARNIPMFYSLRNDPKLENGRITRLMRYFVMLRARGIVFQTKGAQAYFPNKIRNKSVVIHNPVSKELSKYPLNDKYDNRIVFVGRLNKQKNIELLIKAFSKIVKKYDELILEIYGEGCLRESLQVMINEYGLSDKAKLMGAYNDVIDRIYGARMFVLPSLYEGMPNALMEAMALGIPVVASNCPCGGVAELIDDGVNGFLFENGNEEELINTMIKCLDTISINDISKKEREICESHSDDKIFKRWITFVEQGVK